jgi:hypothetical protein
MVSLWNFGIRHPLASVEASLGDRSLGWAMAKLVNRVGPIATGVQIYETDDATALWSQATVTSAGANPITEVNTA